MSGLAKQHLIDGGDVVLEQPRGSRLLKMKEWEELLQHGAKDYETHMCAHNLREPHNHMPYFKPTILRSSVTLQYST